MKCTHHLGQSLKRAIIDGTFLKEMFPGNTVKERNYNKGRFALDIKNGCSADFAAAHKAYINSTTKSLSYATDLKKFTSYFCKF